jgi:hypothetical protein
LCDLLCHVALTTQLAASHKALSKEKAARSAADWSLAEEKNHPTHCQASASKFQ